MSKDLCLTHSGDFKDGFVPDLRLVVEKEQHHSLIKTDGQVFVASAEPRFERCRTEGVVPLKFVSLMFCLVEGGVGQEIGLHLRNAIG